MEEQVELAVPKKPASPSPSEWFNIWKEVIIRPNVQTYRWIIRQANVKTAYTWLVLGFLAMGIMSLVVLLLRGITRSLSIGPITGGIGLFGIVFLAFGVGEIVLISLMTALINLAAKALGGSGNYRELIYCTAAYFVPISIVSWGVTLLLRVFPGLSGVFSLLDLVMSLYGAALQVNAIRAVHYIKTWKAVLAALVLPLLVLVIPVLATSIASLLGLTS